MAASAGYARRQSARAAGRKLAICGSIARGPGVCTACSKTKTVSSLSPLPAFDVTATSCPDPAKPWTREGNVQSRIAEHLAENGFALLQVVDTASKVAGVDLIAAKDGPIQELTPATIDAPYVSLGKGDAETERRPIEQHSLHNVHTVLHGGLAQAVRWELLERNPAAAATAPERVPREARHWSTDELACFLDGAGVLVPLGPHRHEASRSLRPPLAGARPAWSAAHVGERGL